MPYVYKILKLNLLRLYSLVGQNIIIFSKNKYDRIKQTYILLSTVDVFKEKTQRKQKFN